MRFLIINGVNLNLTGTREKGIYGTATLQDINDKIADYCAKNDDEVAFYQSNIEGELVNKLHEAFQNKSADAIFINAGGYTHYSVALHDAIAAIDIPVVEVHISNVHAREEFRHTSMLSKVCKGVVCGFGAGSYIAAIAGMKDCLEK